jgi:hypothetical protein
MAGLVPATQDHPCRIETMGGRHKGGHDDEFFCGYGAQ